MGSFEIGHGESLVAFAHHPHQQGLQPIAAERHVITVRLAPDLVLKELAQRVGVVAVMQAPQQRVLVEHLLRSRVVEAPHVLDRPAQREAGRENRIGDGAGDVVGVVEVVEVVGQGLRALRLRDLLDAGQHLERQRTAHAAALEREDPMVPVRAGTFGGRHATRLVRSRRALIGRCLRFGHLPRANERRRSPRKCPASAAIRHSTRFRPCPHRHRAPASSHAMPGSREE